MRGGGSGKGSADSQTHPSRKGSRGRKGGAAASREEAAAARIVKRLRQEGVRRAKVGGFDIDGVLRGKYISLEKLEAALVKGFGFCDVIFGWDVADALYEAATVTGWHTGYPDAQACLDPSTERRIPWEPQVAAFLVDFRDAQGNPHPACPRSMLKRVLERMGGLGFSSKAAFEFEFFLFQETRDSLVAKNFTDLKPLDPGMFGYSWLRTGQDAELMADLHETLQAAGIPIEGIHTETGPGVYEAALTAEEPLRAADNAALFKTTVKQVAHRHGLIATFMAKWNSSLPGSGGHIHQSLWRGNRSAFFDERAERSMAPAMRHYIGGQLSLMRELTVLMAPTVNSYKRFVPGLWAPLVPSWGVENRTCALRIIGLGQPDALRVEHRQGAADINPYLGLAASLGAGLWGIEHQIEPLEPTEGDPGWATSRALPGSLQEATEALAASRSARDLFGADFVDHYVMTRRWEWECYRRTVTDWELKRYFEAI